MKRYNIFYGVHKGLRALLYETALQIQQTETTVKNADATMKPMFEKILADSKKQLKEAEDPNNKTIIRYRKNYPQNIKDMEAGNQRLLDDWEAQYPANYLLFIKMRLQQFLDETNNIDFVAEITVKNGKKIFINPNYERKSSRWKMAFRAGKEVVVPAREFAKQWIAEIK